MWQIRPNNADWDCFKTPILQEILRIQNLRQVEHCAFLEVIHLFQQVGCVRNKLQFRTAQQNPKSSLWTLERSAPGRFPSTYYVKQIQQPKRRLCMLLNHAVTAMDSLHGFALH